MAKYLLEVTYTPEGIRGLKSEGGTAREAVVSALCESVGGKIESFYFAFGGTDAYIVADFPDDVSAAAAALTMSAGGGASVHTVILLTAAELDGAVAKPATYRPPGR
jgi:uncharacterized protein with GYD domain